MGARSDKSQLFSLHNLICVNLEKEFNNFDGARYVELCSLFETLITIDLASTFKYLLIPLLKKRLLLIKNFLDLLKFAREGFIIEVIGLIQNALLTNFLDFKNDRLWVVLNELIKHQPLVILKLFEDTHILQEAKNSEIYKKLFYTLKGIAEAQPEAVFRFLATTFVNLSESLTTNVRYAFFPLLATLAKFMPEKILELIQPFLNTKENDTKLLLIEVFRHLLEAKFENVVILRDLYFDTSRRVQDKAIRLLREFLTSKPQEVLIEIRLILQNKDFRVPFEAILILKKFSDECFIQILGMIEARLTLYPEESGSFHRGFFCWCSTTQKQMIQRTFIPKLGMSALIPANRKVILHILSIADCLELLSTWDFEKNSLEDSELLFASTPLEACLEIGRKRPNLDNLLLLIAKKAHAKEVKCWTAYGKVNFLYKSQTYSFSIQDDNLRLLSEGGYVRGSLTKFGEITWVAQKQEQSVSSSSLAQLATQRGSFAQSHSELTSQIATVSDTPISEERSDIPRRLF